MEIATKVRYIIEKFRSKEPLDKVDIVARLGEIETEITLTEKTKNDAYIRNEQFWERRYHDAEKDCTKYRELYYSAERELKSSQKALMWSVVANTLLAIAIGFLVI